MLVLILEDNKAIREMLKMALTREKHSTIEASDVAQAKEASLSKEPDLAIVDWMLPDSPGTHFVRWVRRQPTLSTLPIIMLTAKNQAKDTIAGLDAGADDYLSKPVAIDVLMARIRALGRRPKIFQADNHQTTFGPIIINTALHEVSVNGNAVKINKTDYNLLAFLISHPNRVWSRAQLLDRIWGQAAYLDERTVDVHILRLRNALKPHKVDKLVTTVRGAGYQLKETISGT
ncbi:MAG: two-component system phosphate regulon response regulator PhoB [Saprospiraceae bacterium]|jgi:two-component system phosphate regulon response regulator PhoB